MRPSLAGWSSGTVALLLGAALPAQVAHHTPAAAELVAAEAKLDVLAADRQFLEGPVWLPDAAALVCSDIPASMLLRWTAADGLCEWRAAANPNGNTLDHAGRLLTCQHGERNVVRHEVDGTLTVLAHALAGKPFNSPNDLAVRADGSLWFTDPSYGLGKRLRGVTVNGVYRLAPDTGVATVVQTEFEMPNGICFAPDHRRIYIADSGKPQRIGAFDVQASGTLGPAAFWIPQGSDGMRCDARGNLGTTTRGGVVVWAPDATRLATIAVEPQPTNLCFGGVDGTTLFVTARTHLVRIATRATAAALPAAREPRR
jgi:gluconolactonase